MTEDTHSTADVPHTGAAQGGLTGREPTKTQAHEVERRKRRRPSRRRFVVWFVEAIMLAACVEHFLVRPWLVRREPDAPPAKIAVAGELAPLLGERAPRVPGIHEFRAARLPNLTGLAGGSPAARETQVMVSRQHALPVEIENSIGIRFRLIPAGTFALGSPENETGRWEGEAQHIVSVSRPFYLGTYEVTQGQWDAVMPTNPSRFRGRNRPVEEVSWYDCQRFVIALCEKEGVPVGTYRLPTEAEWEYACRAGTTTAYHFGNGSKGLGAFADYAGNNDLETNVVGRRRPNAYGLHDMHGNVWEWCQDLFRAYPGAPPIDPLHREWRMLRGGNWHEGALACRSANRCRLPPLSVGNILGFRVFRRIDAAFLAAPAEQAKGASGAASGDAAGGKGSTEAGAGGTAAVADEEQH